MTYKEFKEKIEDWGIKYDYAIRVTFEDFNTYIEAGTGNDAFIVAHISNIYMFTLETRWNYSTKITNHARGELFDILVDLAKTPPGDRKDEKRFIIPLYRARLKVITNEFIASYLRTQSSGAKDRLKALEIGSKYIHKDYRHLSEFTEDELKKLNIWGSEQWEVEKVEE